MKQKNNWYRIPNRILFMVTGVLILLAVMIASTEPQSGSAAPGDLGSAVAKYPVLNFSTLMTCDLCHTANIPSLNPFGSAYKSKGRNTAAFGTIENLDSDGDGFTNLQEINALTFPGNATSHPVSPTATTPPLPTSTSVPVFTSTPIPTVPVVVPTATVVVPPSSSAYVTTSLSPANVMVGSSAIATVSLNNVPAGGFASAEFTCTYNAGIVEVSNIVATGLFGADPVTVVNGPQNGSFIIAIAGSNGNKALTNGAAFTFSAKGIQAGQSNIDCQPRVSAGNLVLVSLPSTPANLVATSSQGTLTGQVVAGKPVTITLYGSGNAVANSIQANADGTFNLSALAGNYTAVAAAPGYLRAQGSINLTSGNTINLKLISLLAGDIDGNDVIDQFDALTIGINYNGTTPAAADLNNDGTINVLDLEILAGNYRQSGPIAWQ